MEQQYPRAVYEMATICRVSNYVHLCVLCGSEFLSRRKVKTLYCSDACKQQEYRDRRERGHKRGRVRRRGAR